MMMTQCPSDQRSASPYRHQYSELLVTATDSSDSSATYTVPIYPASDCTAYSTTSAIYHQPNCLCHQMACQPPICQSPTHRSDTSATCSESNSSTQKTWSRLDSGNTRHRWKGPIGWIWTAISLVTFSLCILCLTQPNWLVNTKTGESLGLLKQNRMHPTSNVMQKISYRDLTQFALPSTSWVIALVLYGLACTLLGISTLVAMVSTPLRTSMKTRDRVTFWAGFMQLFASKHYNIIVIYIIWLVYDRVELGGLVCHLSWERQTESERELRGNVQCCN